MLHSINCLAALSKCHKLRYLDLSLISESLALSSLFHSISTLHNLETLRFPRSSTYDTQQSNDVIIPMWSPSLRDVHIAGGLNDASIFYFSTVPPTLTKLTIQNCPNLGSLFIDQILDLLGDQLLYLKINYHMPKLGPTSLDHILPRLPKLIFLCLAVDYISEDFFAYADSMDSGHPLKILELDSSETTFTEFGPEHIWLSISEGCLDDLRTVRVSKGLGWTNVKPAALADLNEMLEALGREDRENDEKEQRKVNETAQRLVGVWVFD